jgi:hypothetical protein
MKNLKSYSLLIIFLVVAFLLRVYPPDHGYPFITHPDEPSVIQSGLGLRFDSNPNRFDWPSVYFYLNYMLFMVFAALRNILETLSFKEIMPFLWEEPFIFYYLSRIFSAVTLIPMYLLGKNLKTHKFGLLLAGLFSVIPFHVWHSHYALIDVPATFFVTWSLYFISYVVKDYKSPKYFILSGFFIGLAASTKYNAGLLCLIVPLVLLFNHGLKKDYLKKVYNLVYSGIAAVVGFVLGTPYSVLDFETFSRTDGPKGAFWQFTNVGKESWLATFPKLFVEVIPEKLFFNLGVSLFVLFVIAGIYYLYMNIKWKVISKEFWPFFILAVLLVLYITNFEKSRAHYFIPIYPLITISAGLFILDIVYKVRSAGLRNLFAVAVALPMIYYSILNTYEFSKQTSYQILNSYVSSNLNANDVVLYDSSILSKIFDSFEGTVKDSVRQAFVDTYPNGYIVLGLNQDEYDMFVSKKGPFAFVHEIGSLELFVDGSKRPGNFVLVYKYVAKAE